MCGLVSWMHAWHAGVSRGRRLDFIMHAFLPLSSFKLILFPHDSLVHSTTLSIFSKMLKVLKLTLLGWLYVCVSCLGLANASPVVLPVLSTNAHNTVARKTTVHTTVVYNTTTIFVSYTYLVVDNSRNFTATVTSEEDDPGDVVGKLSDVEVEYPLDDDSIPSATRPAFSAMTSIIGRATSPTATSRITTKRSGKREIAQLPSAGRFDQDHQEQHDLPSHMPDSIESESTSYHEVTEESSFLTDLTERRKAGFSFRLAKNYVFVFGSIPYLTCLQSRVITTEIATTSTVTSKNKLGLTMQASWRSWTMVSVLHTVLLSAILTTKAADPTGNDRVVITAVQPSPSHHSAAEDYSHHSFPISSLRSAAHTPSPIAIPEAHLFKDRTGNARQDCEDMADWTEEDVTWKHQDPEGQPKDEILEKVASEGQTVDLGKHDTHSLPPTHTDRVTAALIKDRNEPVEIHRDILADQSKRIWLQTWRKSGFFAFCQSVYQDIISCIVFCFLVSLFNHLKPRRRRNIHRSTRVFRWSSRSRYRVGGVRRRARASPPSRRQIQRTIRRSRSTHAISSRPSVNASLDGSRWVALEDSLPGRSPAAMGESNPSISLMDSQDVPLDTAHRRGGARFSADDTDSGGDELDPSNGGEP